MTYHTDPHGKRSKHMLVPYHGPTESYLASMRLVTRTRKNRSRVPCIAPMDVLVALRRSGEAVYRGLDS